MSVAASIIVRATLDEFDTSFVCGTSASSGVTGHLALDSVCRADFGTAGLVSSAHRAAVVSPDTSLLFLVGGAASDFEDFQRAVTAFPPEVRRYAVIVDPDANSRVTETGGLVVIQVADKADLGAAAEVVEVPAMRLLRRLTLGQARPVVVDALFVLALTGTALVGLGSTYTETEFWWIGMTGALLAVLTTVGVAVVLRWPSVVAVAGRGGLVLPARPGALPARPGPRRARPRELAAARRRGAVRLEGPADHPATGRRRVAAAGAAVAARPGHRDCSAPCSAWSAPAARCWPHRCRCSRPLALLALVILLGVGRPEALWLQGSVFAVLALAWLGVRYSRTAAPVKSARHGQAGPPRPRSGPGRGRRAARAARRHLGGRQRRGPRHPAHPRRPAVRRGAVPLAAGVLPALRRAAAGAEEPAQPARHDVVHHRGRADRQPGPHRRAGPLRRRRVGCEQQRPARCRQRHLPARLERHRQPRRGLDRSTRG